MRLLAFALVAMILEACGSSPPPAPTVYDDGNQNAPNCPISPGAGGLGAEGARCVDAATDCKPSCCACTGVSDSYWASECDHGVCTSGQQACDDAPSATLCVIPNTVYDDGFQDVNSCSNHGPAANGSGVPGDACSDAQLDCSPACCQCAASVGSYWASECHDGVCANDSVACSDAPSANDCQ